MTKSPGRVKLKQKPACRTGKHLRSQSRCDCWTCGLRNGSATGALARWGRRPREVRNAWAVRARRSGWGLKRHGPAGGLRSRQRLSPQSLSSGTWTSIAVLFNPRMGLHRDIQNMAHLNHALALEDYTGGRVWIEDDEGDSTAWLADKKGGRELRGRWLDMHDKPVSFDARRYHMVEPTRAACGRLRLMFYKPMLERRSSTGRRSRRRGFRCRRSDSAFVRFRHTNPGVSQEIRHFSK